MAAPPANDVIGRWSLNTMDTWLNLLDILGGRLFIVLVLCGAQSSCLIMNNI